MVTNVIKNLTSPGKLNGQEGPQVSNGRQNQTSDVIIIKV